MDGDADFPSSISLSVFICIHLWLDSSVRRILLLITDLEIGGTPTVVRELAVRLHDPPGVHVEVACLSKWGAVAEQLREAEIEVTALNARVCVMSARSCVSSSSSVPAFNRDGLELPDPCERRRGDCKGRFARRAFFSIHSNHPTPAAMALEVAGDSANRGGEASSCRRRRSRTLPVTGRMCREKLVVIPNAVEVESFSSMNRPTIVPRRSADHGWISRPARSSQRVPIWSRRWPCSMRGIDCQFTAKDTSAKRWNARNRSLRLARSVTMLGKLLNRKRFSARSIFWCCRRKRRDLAWC